ncbi:hypothetical protein MARI151_10540 [Maribacter litoralis]|uniref:Uncharacterized protein n=1 Tax=Maribacter litoralis TaxID=2059726 RepID=A0A653N193_9FLAO|nr:hypothetical protein MARI151_10540 [Maribacter litoralis]
MGSYQPTTYSIYIFRKRIINNQFYNLAFKHIRFNVSIWMSILKKICASF